MSFIVDYECVIGTCQSSDRLLQDLNEHQQIAERVKNSVQTMLGGCMDCRSRKATVIRCAQYEKAGINHLGVLPWAGSDIQHREG